MTTHRPATETSPSAGRAPAGREGGPSADGHLQGTGQQLQKELMGRWFGELEAAPRTGRKVAYLFISGNLVELLRAFDFAVVFPEVNALQCGIKHVSAEFILQAEDMGYSQDVCAYVKNDVGLLTRGNRAPMGQIPPPDLLVCNYAGCAIYVKWFEALARYYGAPLFLLDVPYGRGAGPTREELAYVVGQLRELIPLLEEMSGIRYDEDRLREILTLAVQAEDLWVDVLHSARRRPSPIDGYFEAVFFMAPIYVLRGTAECVDYYHRLRAEVEERITHGWGPVPEERFRVVTEGPPPWPHFRAFWEMFKKWGACSVASTYSKVGGIWDFGFRHDPQRPLDSLAEYAFNCYVNWSLPKRRRMLLDYYADYSADGVVIHSVKSCRSFAAGEGDFREEFSQELDIPTLFVESDLVDPRYFSHAQMMNRMDAFFEGLENRKLHGRKEASS